MQKMKINHEPSLSTELNPMDKLLAKLSEQQVVLKNQHEALKSSDDTISYARTVEYVSASSSVPITPANETFNNSTAPTTSPPSVFSEDALASGIDEVARLKAELEAAKGKIARMDEQIAQSRVSKHTIDQAIGISSEVNSSPVQQEEEHFNQLPSFIRPQLQRDNSWAAQDDSRSDTSDSLSATGFNRTRSMWGAGGRPQYIAHQGPAAPYQQPSVALEAAQWMSRAYGQPFVDTPVYPAAPASNYRGERMTSDPELLMAPPMNRRNPANGRFNNRSSAGSFPYASSNSSFDGYTPNPTAYASVGGVSGTATPVGGLMGMGMNAGMNIYGGYQPQPIGTPLSPHAPEFTSSGASSWKNDVSKLKTIKLYELTWDRLLLPRVRLIFPRLNPLTIVVFLTEQSTATGNILLIKSYATTINKLPSFCNKSLKLVLLSKSMTSLRPLSLKLIH